MLRTLARKLVTLPSLTATEATELGAAAGAASVPELGTAWGASVGRSADAVGRRGASSCALVWVRVRGRLG